MRKTFSPLIVTNHDDGCPYSVLLPVGFALPLLLPAARCALTAPFHPCLPTTEIMAAGGLFSVALSLGSPPPGVTRHRLFVEPGLSSINSQRPSTAITQSSDGPDRKDFLSC